MSVIKSFYLTILLGSLICVLHAQNDGEGSRQYIDHPDKNEYLQSQPGTDKHRYGYELRENKHFHHTTTELDGVRLGCYGYVLESKKYSTQYVADIRGYRPVYTYNVIEVYPKSGGTREASFIRNFDEKQGSSENLRYFFPEGCRGFDSEISADKNPMTPFIQTSSTVFTPTSSPPRFVPPPTPTQSPPPRVTEPPRVRPSPSPPTPSVPLIPNTPLPTPPPSTPGTPKITPPEKYLPPAQKYLPPVTKTPIQQPSNGRYVTRAPIKSFPPTVLKPVAPKPIIPQAPKSQPPLLNRISTNGEKNSGCVGCCVDEDSLPKIVIPIKLKNGRSESCPSYAKLIVPADSVSVNSLKSNPTELARMVLQSLA